MDDGRILALLEQRNRDGLKELWKKYGTEMSSIAFGICQDRAEAGEAVNEALARVWDTVPPERPRELSSYVFLLTRESARRTVHRHHTGTMGDPYRMDEILLELGEVFAPNGDGNMEPDRISFSLNRFTERCSDEEYFLFMRRYFYYDSPEALGEQLDMSVGSVKRQLAKMRARLKEFLEAEGIGI